MFENISQLLFYSGSITYLIVIPFLRLLTILFMGLSTYKILKARQESFIIIWLVAICFAPFITRIVYEICRRWICKKENVKVKGSNGFLIASIIAYLLSFVLLVVSFFTMGVGFIKSVIDGEFISTFYDVKGNEYPDPYNIPLYDIEGNEYLYESQFFTLGNYIDQNGKTFEGGYCFLSEDGWFYYFENDEVLPCDDEYNYYTDGEKFYYRLTNQVYWDKDGEMYELSGRLHIKLFDFN